ncbi:hypothetical protein LuPra_02684 [Luteitalea pratensis]|uniref:Uncharacterized protein n=1 Tax=Luteitalea pratensis TaxID=1855912 RepID=A0A143PLM0_LUTPR|nr:hypothetical protein LuPra_02684 [Luteitalea pratensis]
MVIHGRPADSRRNTRQLLLSAVRGATPLACPAPPLMNAWGYFWGYVPIWGYRYPGGIGARRPYGPVLPHDQAYENDSYLWNSLERVLLTSAPTAERPRPSGPSSPPVRRCQPDRASRQPTQFRQSVGTHGRVEPACPSFRRRALVHGSHWARSSPNPGTSPTDRRRLGSAKLGHPVEDTARQARLDRPATTTPGTKAIADDGLVAEEGVLDAGLPMVARGLLPVAPAEPFHVGDRAIARTRARSAIPSPSWSTAPPPARRARRRPRRTRPCPRPRQP